MSVDAKTMAGEMKASGISREESIRIHAHGVLADAVQALDTASKLLARLSPEDCDAVDAAKRDKLCAAAARMITALLNNRIVKASLPGAKS